LTRKRQFCNPSAKATKFLQQCCNNISVAVGSIRERTELAACGDKKLGSKLTGNRIE